METCINSSSRAAANQLQYKDTLYNGHFPHKLGLACSMSVSFLNMFQKRNAQASKLYIPSVPNVLHVGANEQCQSIERNTQHRHHPAVRPHPFFTHHSTGLEAALLPLCQLSETSFSIRNVMYMTLLLLLHTFNNRISRTTWVSRYQ